MADLRAGWAVRGKPPGSYDEYRVTGCGGPDFSATDYAHILRHFALGTPSPGRSGPAALPWITISEVRGADDGTRIGIALEDWTGEADGAGRPIAETRYFCVPYEALRAAPVSYAGLYEALAAAAPPFPADGLDLHVPALDPTEPAATIERFGVQRVAAAASLLLDGPVTITNAPDLSASDRLAFLDAVAALLPYGWRTRFSAATWDQSGNRNVSLAFARRVRDRTTELDWRTPRLPERSNAGRAYARMLVELLGEGGRSPADVIAHLAAAGEPLADADPGTAIHVLGRPVAVVQDQRDLVDVRELLRSGRYRELADARSVLSELIRADDPGDVPLLRGCWTAIAGTSDAPYRELCGAARRVVWGGAAAVDGRNAAQYVELAGDLGRADDLLAVLLGPAGRGEDETVGAATAALIVLDAVDPAAAARWPATLDALAASPGVLCALITELAFGPPDSLVAWFRMLTRHLPESLLDPFCDVLFVPLRPAEPKGLEALAEHGTGCVSDLVTLASDMQRLGYVLPGLADWLTARDRVPANERMQLTIRLTQARSSEPDERGVLDGLLLWLGAPPRHVTGVRAGGHEGYWDGFRSVWTRTMPAPRTDRRPEILASWVRAGGWAGSAGGADAVLRLVRELTAGLPDEGRPLARALLAARARVPGIDRAAMYRIWWDEAVRRCPELLEEFSA
ncbi:hypothetical protein [Actinomadura violacea]|uniref:Uncharacterized protein n=1 Tax=Actinomadura violacea TaxID=2819934 RepID=A0ABS3RHY5_9ACTN|nr:hypothetical protein [Actinomadura violacea]MBO2456334.1 hypothetical protein [Actinomadura violacea]